MVRIVIRHLSSNYGYDSLRAHDQILGKLPMMDGDLPMIWGVYFLCFAWEQIYRIIEYHRWGNLRWSSLVIVCYRSAAKKKSFANFHLLNLNTHCYNIMAIVMALIIQLSSHLYGWIVFYWGNLFRKLDGGIWYNNDHYYIITVLLLLYLYTIITVLLLLYLYTISLSFFLTILCPYQYTIVLYHINYHDRAI